MLIRPYTIEEALKMGGRLLKPSSRGQRVLLTNKVGGSNVTRIYETAASGQQFYPNKDGLGAQPVFVRISQTIKKLGENIRTKLDTTITNDIQQMQWGDRLTEIKRTYFPKGKLKSVKTNVTEADFNYANLNLGPNLEHPLDFSKPRKVYSD